jgi:glycosyltransferase involved in cell wall biosynthesis
MNPKITVVTVCYNTVHSIEKTILSVINQTYPNIEYIIIDGGSTDGTVEIIKKYSDKIAYWVSELDGGIYDAMNKGIKAATGEWINFMNAGDWFLSENVLSDLRKNLSDDIKILRGNIIRIYDNFKVKSEGITSQEPSFMDMISVPFHHQACLINLELFHKFGLYSTHYKLCSDWKFFFDCIILHHIKTKYIDYSVAAFRMDGISSKHTIDYGNEYTDYLENLYGKDIVSCLEELKFYRRFSFLRSLYHFYKRKINRMSSKTFNHILNFKRVMYSIVGKKVH